MCHVTDRKRNPAANKDSTHMHKYGTCVAEEENLFKQLSFHVSSMSMSGTTEHDSALASDRAAIHPMSPKLNVDHNLMPSIQQPAYIHVLRKVLHPLKKTDHLNLPPKCAGFITFLFLPFSQGAHPPTSRPRDDQRSNPTAETKPGWWLVAMVRCGCRIYNNN